MNRNAVTHSFGEEEEQHCKAIYSAGKGNEFPSPSLFPNIALPGD